MFNNPQLVARIFSAPNIKTDPISPLDFSRFIKMMPVAGKSSDGGRALLDIDVHMIEHTKACIVLSQIRTEMERCLTAPLRHFYWSATVDIWCAQAPSVRVRRKNNY